MTEVLNHRRRLKPPLPAMSLLPPHPLGKLSVPPCLRGKILAVNTTLAKKMNLTPASLESPSAFALRGYDETRRARFREMGLPRYNSNSIKLIWINIPK